MKPDLLDPKTYHLALGQTLWPEHDEFSAIREKHEEHWHLKSQIVELKKDLQKMREKVKEQRMAHIRIQKSLDSDIDNLKSQNEALQNKVQALEFELAIANGEFGV